MYEIVLPWGLGTACSLAYLFQDRELSLFSQIPFCPFIYSLNERFFSEGLHLKDRQTVSVGHKRSQICAMASKNRKVCNFLFLIFWDRFLLCGPSWSQILYSTASSSLVGRITRLHHDACLSDFDYYTNCKKRGVSLWNISIMCFNNIYTSDTATLNRGVWEVNTVHI